MRYGKLIACAVLLLFICSVATGSGPAKKKETAGPVELSDEMQQWLKLGEPGVHHEHLALLAGLWTISGTSWEKPGSEPLPFTGEAKSDMIMDGRYLKTVYRGEFLGMEFEGRGFEGYDNIQHKYVAIWIDSMSTMIMMQTGTCRNDGKTRTMVSEFTDPASGQVMKTRSVYDFTGEDNYVYTSYMILPDGTEFKNFEMNAVRKK